MRHTRIDIEATALRAPYRTQELVGEQWRHGPLLPDGTLPIQVQHIQRVSSLPVWSYEPDGREQRAPIDTVFKDPGILAAASELTLELEERALWLTAQATEDNTSQTEHALKATLPLELGDGFSDVRAQVGFYNHAARMQGRRRAAPQLGYLSIELSGTNTAEGDNFWTYASISDHMLDLAHPQTAGYVPKILYGPSLIDGFELRDMLTFVENSAPDTG